jgi:hypothetical protein
METRAPWTLKVRTILALAMDDERGRDLQSKAIRRRLRELAGQAYARELGAELAKLEADFARWRSGEIDPFELSDRIHRFHNGRSRDLYVFYDPRDSEVSVARAVGHRILDRTEVPPEILAALEGKIEYFARMFAENEPDEGG